MNTAETSDFCLQCRRTLATGTRFGNPFRTGNFWFSFGKKIDVVLTAVLSYNLVLVCEFWYYLYFNFRTVHFALCLGITNKHINSYQFIISLSCSYMFRQLCAIIRELVCAY
jgi:hypothetical protein